MGHTIAFQDVRVAVLEGGVLVGRSPACTLVLEGDLVSRRHAIICVRDGAPMVEDLASANGVFVNNERIDKRCALQDGDAVSIGGHELRFVVDGESAPNEGQKRAATAFVSDDIDDVFDVEISSFGSGEPTTRNDRLILVVTSSAVAIGRGEVDKAESKLSRHLQNLLKNAQEGKRVDAATHALGVKGSLDLARATKKKAWLGYLFALHAATSRPISISMTEKIDKIIDTLEGEDATPSLTAEIRAYANVMRKSPGAAGEPLLAWLDGLLRDGRAGP